MCKPASLKTIATALNAVMAVPIDDLEKAMQLAHECNSKQMHDPPKSFTVSHQALRMLWHFRCNIDAVEVFTEPE